MVQFSKSFGHRLLNAAAIALALVVYSLPGFALPIPVTNDDFETPVLQSKDYLGYSGSTQYGWIRDAGWGACSVPEAPPSMPEPVSAAPTQLGSRKAGLGKIQLSPSSLELTH